MPMPDISLQLYSVREELAVNYEKTIRKLSEIGFKNLEPAGFSNTTPEDALKLFKELDITVSSMHVPFPIGDAQNEAIETALMFGAEYLVSGFGPDDFLTYDSIKKVADQYNEVAVALKKHNLKIAYHNHWWEMEEIYEGFAYDILIKNTIEDVLFEVDTYWVRVGRKNPVSVVKNLRSRAPLLHIKDGPGNKKQAMYAVGTGLINFPDILNVAKYAKYLIIELDRCDTDMMVAIEKSYDYLLELSNKTFWD